MRQSRALPDALIIGGHEVRHEFAAQLPDAAQRGDRAAAQGSALLRREFPPRRALVPRQFRPDSDSPGSTSTVAPYYLFHPTVPQRARAVVAARPADRVVARPGATRLFTLLARARQRAREPVVRGCSRGRTRPDRSGGGAAGARRDRAQPSRTSTSVTSRAAITRSSSSAGCSLSARTDAGAAVRGPRQGCAGRAQSNSGVPATFRPSRVRGSKRATPASIPRCPPPTAERLRRPFRAAQRCDLRSCSASRSWHDGPGLANRCVNRTQRRQSPQRFEVSRFVRCRPDALCMPQCLTEAFDHARVRPRARRRGAAPARVDGTDAGGRSVPPARGSPGACPCAGKDWILPAFGRVVVLECCPDRPRARRAYSGCSATTRMIWSSSGSIGKALPMLAPGLDIHASQIRAALVVEHRHQRVPRACRGGLRLRDRQRLRLVFAEIDHGAAQDIRACGPCRCSARAAAASDARATGIPAAPGAAAGLRPRAGCRRARAQAGSQREKCAYRPASSACPNALFNTTFAVLRPTPGSSSSASRCCGTVPSYFSSRTAHVARMFFTLPGYSPIVRTYAVSPSCPSARIAAGVLATGNNLRVARLTPLSVACAERITAISNSNGVEYSSSVTGCGFNAAKRSKSS